MNDRIAFGFAIVAVIFFTLSVCIDDESSISHEEDRARELVTRHETTYKTAIAVGETDIACREISMALLYAIDTHDVSLAQHYRDLKVQTCQ